MHGLRHRALFERRAQQPEVESRERVDDGDAEPAAVAEGQLDEGDPLYTAVPPVGRLKVESQGGCRFEPRGQ